MFCSKCGAKLADSARFCSACGAPMAMSPASKSGQIETLNSAVEDGKDGVNSGQESAETIPATAREGEGFMQRLVAFRRTTLKAVPTFVLAIVAFLAAAGTAYAAYKVVTEVVIPAIEKVGSDSKSVDQGGMVSAKVEEADKNDLAHEAYEKVLDDYRQLLAEQADAIAAAGESGTMLQSDRTWAWTGDYYFTSADGGVLYAYRDLNEDGVDELLITLDGDQAVNNGGNGGLILCGFAYVDGEIVRFAESIVRSFFWLNRDGSICCSGSGGFDTGGCGVKRWNGTELVDVSSMTWGPANYDDRGNPTSPYQLEILTGGEKSEEIVTYEECTARVKAWRNEHRDYANVEWKSLSVA